MVAMHFVNRHFEFAFFASQTKGFREGVPFGDLHLFREGPVFVACIDDIACMNKAFWRKNFTPARFCGDSGAP